MTLKSDVPLYDRRQVIQATPLSSHISTSLGLSRRWSLIRVCRAGGQAFKSRRHVIRSLRGTRSRSEKIVDVDNSVSDRGHAIIL